MEVSKAESEQFAEEMWAGSLYDALQTVEDTLEHQERCVSDDDCPVTSCTDFECSYRVKDLCDLSADCWADVGTELPYCKEARDVDGDCSAARHIGMVAVVAAVVAALK